MTGTPEPRPVTMAPAAAGKQPSVKSPLRMPAAEPEGSSYKPIASALAAATSRGGPAAQEELRQALQRHPEAVNGVDSKGKTAAIVVLDRPVGKKEELLVGALRVLHEHGADMNKAPGGVNEGWAPMHYASMRSHASAILALQEMGADPSLPNEDLDTPLHALLQHIANSNTPLATETTEALVAAGTDLRLQNKEGDNVLHLAGCNDASAPVIEALVKGGQRQGCLREVLAQRNEDGDTPLLSLMRNSRISAAFARTRGGRGHASDPHGGKAAADPIGLYLAEGAEWEAVNTGADKAWRGFNALHIAIACQDQGLVQALLDRDATGEHAQKYALLRAHEWKALRVAEEASAATKQAARSAIIQSLKAHKRLACAEGKEEQEVKPRVAKPPKQGEEEEADGSRATAAGGGGGSGAGKKRKAFGAAGGATKVKAEDDGDEEEQEAEAAVARPAKKEKALGKENAAEKKKRKREASAGAGAEEASKHGGEGEKEAAVVDEDKGRQEEEERQSSKPAAAVSVQAPPPQAAASAAEQQQQQRQGPAQLPAPKRPMVKTKGAKRPRTEAGLAVASSGVAAAAAAAAPAATETPAQQVARLMAEIKPAYQAEAADNVQRLKEREGAKMTKFTGRLQAAAVQYRELVEKWYAAPVEPDGQRETKAGLEERLRKLEGRAEQMKTWLAFWVGVAGYAIRTKKGSDADRAGFAAIKGPAEEALAAWAAGEEEGEPTRSSDDGAAEEWLVRVHK